MLRRFVLEQLHDFLNPLVESLSALSPPFTLRLLDALLRVEIVLDELLKRLAFFWRHVARYPAAGALGPALRLRRPLDDVAPVGVQVLVAIECCLSLRNEADRYAVGIHAAVELRASEVDRIRILVERQRVGLASRKLACHVS